MVRIEWCVLDLRHHHHYSCILSIRGSNSRSTAGAICCAGVRLLLCIQVTNLNICRVFVHMIEQIIGWSDCLRISPRCERSLSLSQFLCVRFFLELFFLQLIDSVSFLQGPCAHFFSRVLTNILGWDSLKPQTYDCCNVSSHLLLSLKVNSSDDDKGGYKA